MKRQTRAEDAGRHLARSIIEMVNLMYQLNTAKNFYNGLIDELEIHKKYFTTKGRYIK
jgi:hypothetical protein